MRQLLMLVVFTGVSLYLSASKNYDLLIAMTAIFIVASLVSIEVAVAGLKRVK